MAHTHIVYANIQNTTPNITENSILLARNFNTHYEMAEEAFYNYEINYPENFTTIMATFTRRFFVVILNIVFTMMLTSYIIDGTPPQDTLHWIWTILFNFPVYMENTRRRREQEQEQEAEPDFNPVDSDEELEDVFDDDEPSVSTPEHVQEVEVEYDEPNYLSRPGNLGKVPEVGDLIIFDSRNISIEEEDELAEEYGIFDSVPRCISTYGQKPIVPKPGFTCDETDEYFNGEIYVVTSISSHIPNCKPAVNRRIHGEVDPDITPYTHLFVEPLGESDENSRDFSSSIFWYINFEALAICQHESGSITDFIDNLRIIGHDDRFSRSEAPTPESLDGLDEEKCSQLEDEDEDSDSYDIIDNEPESETSTTKVPNMLSNLGTKNWDDGLKFYGGDPNYNDGDY